MTLIRKLEPKLAKMQGDERPGDGKKERDELQRKRPLIMALSFLVRSALLASLEDPHYPKGMERRALRELFRDSGQGRKGEMIHILSESDGEYPLSHDQIRKIWQFLAIILDWIDAKEKEEEEMKSRSRASAGKTVNIG